MNRHQPEHEHSDNDTGDHSVKVSTRDFPNQRPRRRREGVIVWGFLTLGFLAYVAFGSVTIHQWRWNAFLQEVQEDVELVRLVEVWSHQAARLPDVEIEVMVSTGFYAALFVFIGGCIAGSWLLLNRAGTGSGSDQTPTTRSDA